MIMGSNVTRLELTVCVLISSFLSMYQHNSCIAPKWHAHPQKKRPNNKVNINAEITNIAPALITPSFKKE